jgi:hypothetical protein
MAINLIQIKEVGTVAIYISVVDWTRGSSCCSGKIMALLVLIASAA